MNWILSIIHHLKYWKYIFFYVIKGEDPTVKTIKVREPTNGMFQINTPNSVQTVTEDCVGITNGNPPKLFDMSCEDRTYDRKKLLPLCQRIEPDVQGKNIELFFNLF